MGNTSAFFIAGTIYYSFWTIVRYMFGVRYTLAPKSYVSCILRGLDAGACLLFLVLMDAFFQAVPAPFPSFTLSNTSALGALIIYCGMPCLLGFVFTSHIATTYGAPGTFRERIIKTLIVAAIGSAIGILGLFV